MEQTKTDITAVNDLQTAKNEFDIVNNQDISSGILMEETAVKGRTKEEIANTLTHFAGVLIGLSTSWILIIKSFLNDWQSQFAAIIFSISVLFMYTASTIYHWTPPGKAKKILRYFDHINIYILIAASYTPIMLCSVGGTLGWVMFGIIWSLVLAGTFYKIFFLGKYPKLSLALYLLMGWMVVMIAKPLYDSMPLLALIFIVCEGLAYTSGTFFYANDKKYPYFHAVWHIFVLMGTIFHGLEVWMVL